MNTVPAPTQGITIAINKFANNYSIEKKRLKIKSFHAYHLCQFSCFKAKTPSDNEFCLQLCDKDYEDYIDFKKKQRLDSEKKFKYYFAFPESNDPATINSPQKRDEKISFERECLDMEIKMQNYITVMKNYLKSLDDKYTGKKQINNIPVYRYQHCFTFDLIC